MRGVLSAVRGYVAPPLPSSDRGTRAVLRSVVVVATVAAFAVATAFVLVGAFRRPFGGVEAEIVDEAVRVAQGLPIYFDPAKGAWEHGAPPTRYFALYTPIWPWILAHLGASTPDGIRLAGRIANDVAWYGVLGFVVARAPSARRPYALVAAALAASLFFLTRQTMLATADAFASAFAALAFERTCHARAFRHPSPQGRRHEGRPDAIAGALFVVAAFVKPNVVGLAVGVMGTHVLFDRLKAFRAVAGAAAVGIAFVALCYGMSAGYWPKHMFVATARAFHPDRFVDQFFSRCVVLGIPQLVLGVVAFRRDRRLGLPLLASTVWTSVLMGKEGSATNYWLEPTLAAVVVVAHLPTAVPSAPDARPGDTNRLVALAYEAGAATLAVLVFVLSVPSYVKESRSWGAEDAKMAELRAACPLGPGGVVVSGEPEIELALDGRVILPSWEMTALVKQGKFPLDVWAKDLEDPHVQYLVHAGLGEPLPPVWHEGGTEYDAFRDELAGVIARTYVKDRDVGGFVVMRRR